RTDGATASSADTAYQVEGGLHLPAGRIEATAVFAGDTEASNHTVLAGPNDELHWIYRNVANDWHYGRVKHSGGSWAFLYFVPTVALRDTRYEYAMRWDAVN